MAFVPSHQNLGSCVGQAQPHESATHEHGGSQQDGDCFGNADQGAKYQVSQDRRSFTESIQEAEARGSARERNTGKVQQTTRGSPALDLHVPRSHFQWS